jgi:chaperonin GroEL
VEKKGLKGTNDDQNAGIRIALKAKEQPLREIVRNAGTGPSVVLDRVSEGETNYGYNTQTGEFGDMVAMGILYPTKVVRSAPPNAASVAGLMIATATMVAERPRKSKAGSVHGTGEIDDII